MRAEDLWITRVVCAIVCGASAATFVPSALAADFDCLIEPRQVVEIRSPIEGLISRVHVDRGDFVRRGQVVAEIDSSVELAAAAVAKQKWEMDGAVRAGESRVEYSTRKAARSEELHRDNYVSAEARDQAATERRLAEAELRDASDNRKVAELEYKRQMEIIRLKTIRSPLDGVVVERIMNVGELAEAGVGRKPIFKLAEIGMLYVEVLLPAEAYGQMKLGMQADIKPEIGPAVSRHATVKVIDRVLDAASGTFGVRLELPNPQRTIPAGIRCMASFPSIRVSATPKIRAREGPAPKPRAAMAPAK